MGNALEHAFDIDARTERRAHERLPVELMGRCLLSNGLEIPCQATDISPGDVGIVAGHSPETNDNVVVYLDQVGRLSGHVARVFESGFAIILDATPRKREKLAAQIEWLKSHNEFNIPDEPSPVSAEPVENNTKISLSDGRSYDVEIIDISISGASVKSSVRPALGTKIQLSGMNGTIVRHFDEGMAIEFADYTEKADA